MKWFRSNIKSGARLALLALALQFGLSFGHFHADAGQAATLAVQSVTAQSDTSAVTSDAVTASALLPASHDDSDHHPGKDCALCAIIALASTVLSATPPAMPLPQAGAFRYLVTDAEFADLNPVGLAFQPRAPPAS
jgi:hypothetical protein